MKIARFLPAIGLAALVLLTGFPSQGQTPKSGGWLTLRLREDLPQGFAINESATISTMWPAMPCLSNLVLFDPLKPSHSMDTVVGELAERWSWQDSYRKLVFFLRKDVKWHDGKVFTAEDVLFTYKAMMNPKTPTAYRDDFELVRDVQVLDPYTVRVIYSQPYAKAVGSWGTPMLPKHLLAKYVEEGKLREAPQNTTSPVGTGPYKFVEYVPGSHLIVERNEATREVGSFRTNPTVSMKTVSGSLPDGLTSPNKIRASARPPSWPGYHAWSMARTFSRHGMATGLPVSSTTIVLGLADATASMTASCPHGSERSGRS